MIFIAVCIDRLRDNALYLDNNTLYLDNSSLATPIVGHVSVVNKQASQTLETFQVMQSEKQNFLSNGGILSSFNLKGSIFRKMSSSKPLSLKICHNIILLCMIPLYPLPCTPKLSYHKHQSSMGKFLTLEAIIKSVVSGSSFLSVSAMWVPSMLETKWDVGWVRRVWWVIIWLLIKGVGWNE